MGTSDITVSPGCKLSISKATEIKGSDVKAASSGAGERTQSGADCRERAPRGDSPIEELLLRLFGCNRKRRRPRPMTLR